jgi:hypothetical protein
MNMKLVLVILAVNMVKDDSFFFFQLCADDGLPSQVCLRCSQLVNLSYEFKLQCESSDATLRQYLKSHIQVTIVGHKCFLLLNFEHMGNIMPLILEL